MPRKRETSDETMGKVFPTRLRQLMEENKTTMQQLGDAIHVQRQTVSNYSLGQSSPDWETLKTICEYFGVSSDYLLGLTDVPRKGMTIREIVAIDEIVDALDSASKRLKGVLAKEET